MRHFLKYCCVFFSILLAMGIILEISARHVPNPVLAKRMLIEEHGAGMKTIIIGPSVAQEGVNPALLGDSVYNLAIDGQRPIFNILQFTTHYKKMTSLRNVIYVIYPEMYWEAVDNDRPYIRVQTMNHRLYMGLDVGGGLRTGSEVLSDAQTAISKCIKGYLSSRPTVYTDSLGFIHRHSLDIRGKELRHRVDAQSRQHPASEESRREFSRHADMLDSLASLCCSEDIKLYLVLPPVHRSLLTGIDSLQFALMDKLIHNMDERHDCVKAINYAGDSRFDNDNFFWDAVHLTNDSGAAALSSALRTDLGL